MRFSLGTHNLEDEHGTPTFFADVVIYTEAVPRRIRDRLNALRAGYKLVVCHEQPDLVVAVRKRLFKVKGTGYKRYVTGIPKVTPNRGTFVVYTQTADHKPLAIIAEHRINAAFPPYIRGEAEFRRKAWKSHTDGTWDTIRRLIDSGYVVCGGGDVNTPEGIPGYPIGLHERGHHYDRLFANRPIGQVTYKSRKGSDHPRLIATVQI